MTDSAAALPCAMSPTTSTISSVSSLFIFPDLDTIPRLTSHQIHAGALELLTSTTAYQSYNEDSNAGHASSGETQDDTNNATIKSRRLPNEINLEAMTDIS